jgi:hypothetical protein
VSVIKAICGGGAEMRRSGDIAVSLGGMHKCLPYAFAFTSTKHAGSQASPTGHDFDFFDADCVSSAAFEQSAGCANILPCV